MSEGSDGTEPRRAGKSEAAFRTISEVADELEVPQHVLRFWEGRFPQVRPLKRGGGRRYYRPEDVALLRRIRDLLYREGYTIKGAQKALRDGGSAASDLPPLDDDHPFPPDDDEDEADLAPPPVLAPSLPERPVPVTPRPAAPAPLAAPAVAVTAPVSPVPPAAVAGTEPARLRPETRQALGELLDELEELRSLLLRA
ncbi:MerR family transcriptional regulator [Phaeospirillum tilakii]|uniref:MerR family transcriptional regulator n=1 Tax=Phaeospirillum tilakii TaxID=741673 RepID=A0ABW5CEN5_9PROT